MNTVANCGSVVDMQVEPLLGVFLSREVDVFLVVELPSTEHHHRRHLSQTVVGIKLPRFVGVSPEELEGVLGMLPGEGDRALVVDRASRATVGAGLVEKEDNHCARVAVLWSRHHLIELLEV